MKRYKDRGLVIRELRWGDFEQMAANYSNYYDELRDNPHFGLILDRDRPSASRQVDWFAALFKGFIEGRTIAVVAELDGKVVGDCDIRIRPDLEGLAHQGFLDIAVTAPHRGMGIGRALMNAVLSEAKGKIEIVFLDVLADNEAAKMLYSSLGFIHCATMPKLLKRGNIYLDVDRMYMETGSFSAG